MRRQLAETDKRPLTSACGVSAKKILSLPAVVQGAAMQGAAMQGAAMQGAVA